MEIVVDSQDVKGMEDQTLPATESQVEEILNANKSPKEPLREETTPTDFQNSQKATSPALSMRSMPSTGDSNGNVAEHQLNS